MDKILPWMLIVLFISCASAPPLTEAEQNYLYKIINTPLEWHYAKQNDALYWGRAQSYVGQYSSMKIQIATEFILQTYNPPEKTRLSDLTKKDEYGYYITKTPLSNDSFSISIRSIPETEDGIRNAKICSWYIKTGELPPDLRLISR
jgi:hypothetical protein